MQMKTSGERLNILFCFVIVLQLENVDHEGLPVLAHVAQDNSLGFVESRICAKVRVRIRGRQCVQGARS